MLATACFQEESPFDVSDMISDEGERTEITVSFSDPTLSLVKVRNSILEGAETVHSGATIYAFLHDGYNMVLDDIITVEGASVQGPGHDATTQNAVLHLRSGKTYDICVVGNLWYINKSTGKKASWINTVDPNSPEAAAPESYYAAVEASYRFNGSDAGNGYRHETLAEVKTYGIPYSGQKTGVTAVKNGTVNLDNCRFLFAKVNLTVDHTGLDGELDGSEGYFKNSKVSIRQANGSIVPLNVPNMLYDADNAIDADGDPSMTNAHKKTYTFYVPENLQGDLLTTDDPNLKNLENGELEPVKDLLTYLEFKGTVNPSNAYAAQIGYTGDFTYRFCLGTDNCKNFDVVGGRCYDITLNFTVNSLFNPEAEWKVSSDSFLDGRVVDVMKFTDCAEALGASQPVIVRANRPGKVFLYVNKEGVATGGTNAMKGRNLVTSVASYTPSDVTDCAVCISPALSSLSEYGITAAYTASDASLSFSVTNMSKFASWLSSGQDVKLTATLLPSKDNAKKREFVLKPFADLGVSGNFDEFYVAMKRTVTCSGFYGNNVKLYNGSEKAGSPNLKYVKESTRVQIGNASHPYTIEGNGSFDVVSCRETDSSNQCTLCVSSDDEFNDGVKSVAVTVKRPWPEIKVPTSGCNLYVHGDHCNMELNYYTTEGHKKRIEPSLFDKTEYMELLAPSLSMKGTNSGSGAAAADAVFEQSVRSSMDETDLDRFAMYVYELPETYASTKSYSGSAEWSIPYFVELGASEELAGDVIPGLVIPAFDKTSRYSSEPVNRVDDYTPFPDRPAEQTFLTPESYTYSYGAASEKDILFDIVPRTVGVGKNGALTAELTNVSGGRVLYTIRRGSTSTPHSLGYHSVKPYTKNINSGQVVRSHHNAVAKVTVHNVLAANLSLVGSAPVYYTVERYQIPDYHYIWGVKASTVYDCGVAYFDDDEQVYTGGHDAVNYPGVLVTSGSVERCEYSRGGGGINYLDVARGLDPNDWPFHPGDSGYRACPWGQPVPAGDRSWVMDNCNPNLEIYYLEGASPTHRSLEDKEIGIEVWKDTLPNKDKRSYLFLKGLSQWIDRLY